MIRPRKISALVGRVMETDPNVEVIDYRRKQKTLYVQLRSALAWERLLEEIDLPVKSQFDYKAPTDVTRMTTERFFVIIWDCSEIGRVEPSSNIGFAFGKNEAKRARKRVSEQEEEGARIIGGRRHVGSGALSDLKSDASSAEWQQEAKSTKHKSFGLKLEILEKITREARVQDKKPMVFLRFTDIPDDMSVESDWVVIPKSVFEELEE